MKICAKTIFTVTFPVTLTFRSQNCSSRAGFIVSLVQRYVSIKLDFLRLSYFEKNVGTRHTVGLTAGVVRSGARGNITITAL